MTAILNCRVAAIVWSLVLCLGWALGPVAQAWEQGPPTADGYTEAPVYWSRPLMTRDYELGQVGVTGLDVVVKTGKVVTVNETLPGTPAAGKFAPGEVLTGVNGEGFAGRNPFVVLGTALTAAEASDGRLVFAVQGAAGGPTRQVTVTIPVLGAYSETWPLDCPKSRAIIAAAAAYYSSAAFTASPAYQGHSLEGALGCLFLLSTGDDGYLPLVKRYLAGAKVDGSNWHNGYNGILCAEYFLRTGDATVMPLLQAYCDAARQRQKFNSAWTHGGTGLSPRYVAGGLMNPASVPILTSLLLAETCGADVDAATLMGSLRFFYRFVGHGTVPYGDHRAEGGLGSNGKDAMLAAAMQVAMGAEGDTRVYREARDTLSMATLTSYPNMVTGHANSGRGDGMWRGLASAYLLAGDPALYHGTMNRIRWWYDLSRRPGGGFGVSLSEPNHNNPGSGAGLALAYTAPLRTLQITGAPRSPHAKALVLPETVWGRPADRAFHQVTPAAGYGDFGADEPIHGPFFALGSSYAPPSMAAADVPLDYLRQMVRHRRYLIRAQAAKTMRQAGHIAELEALLDDPDPRLRRAALDGMIDYKFWFVYGKTPMATEQLTPGMIASIRRMLADPDEALWVVDGALLAMRLAPLATIQESLPLIMPWTRHDDWWLREAAFFAIAGLERDEQAFAAQLPTLLQMMTDETHTQPRERMTNLLQKPMRQKQDDALKERLVAGFLEAARHTTILPDTGGNPRSIEGKYNVFITLRAVASHAPQSEMGTVARVFTDYLDSMVTMDIVKLLATPGGFPDGSAPAGIYPALAALPPAERETLRALLVTVYLPELTERWRTQSGMDPPNVALLLGTISDLVRLKDPQAGWLDLGQTPAAQRTWRFTALDEPPAQEPLPRTPGGMVKNLPLPTPLQNWPAPRYDADAWASGRAPIGVGRFAWKHSKQTFENASSWPAGEFLLARSEFHYDGRDYDAYQIRVLAPRSFRVYLNGALIHNYIWWQKLPQYRPIILGPDELKHLKPGRNVLAVQVNTMTVDGQRVGQVDVLIEGLDLAED